MQNSSETSSEISSETSSETSSERGQLLFFGEDWGRHPSTAQYLASQLLDEFSVTWINSIGLREPSLSIADLNRVAGKVQRALGSGEPAANKPAINEPAASEPAVNDAPQESDTTVDPQYLVSPWILPLHRFSAVQALNKQLFKRQIAQQAHLQAAPYTVLTANPASYYLLDTLSPSASVYYCADKYAHIAGLNPKLVDRFERELLERVDAVAATSLPLVNDLSKHHSNVHYLPHGVDFERFSSALSTDAVSAETPERKPVIGFIGLLGEHIDFELITACASELDDAHFLFVGPVEQGITLPQAANIEYVGSVPQSELPKQIRRMDVCTLPYSMTQRNHYANPTKVREYLAAGRAVVATKQPGLADIDGEVSIASDTAGYLSALRERLAELPPQDSAERNSQRSAIAETMKNETWAARAQTLRDLIGGLNERTKR